MNSSDPSWHYLSYDHVLHKTWSGQVRLKYLCFLPLCVLGNSSVGALKMSLNKGTYFLKMTDVTVKFLSSFSVLCWNSLGRLAMSCHFFILLKNSIRLKCKITLFKPQYSTVYFNNTQAILEHLILMCPCYTWVILRVRAYSMSIYGYYIIF